MTEVFIECTGRGCQKEADSDLIFCKGCYDYAIDEANSKGFDEGKKEGIEEGRNQTNQE